MAEHIIAVFENEVTANSAVQSLIGIGISQGAIRQYTLSQADREGLTGIPPPRSLTPAAASGRGSSVRDP